VILPNRRRKKPEAEAQPAGGFAALGLSSTTLAALEEAGYLEPTPIQGGLIPRAMEGDDLMGQARTGTGKTAAFAIPILERLEPHKPKEPPQALVLVPTRELAVQVRDECRKLALGRKTHIVALYGGKPIRQQVEHLRQGADVVVGTPGRILDHLARGTLALGAIRVVVLDEADRMLDIGFRPDIEKILRRCPQSRQTLLFSATIPPPVMRLAERYMRDPAMMDFSPQDITVETIDQHYFAVPAEDKFELLVRLLRRENPRQAIVFCRTRRGTEKVYQRLAKKLEGAACIHGDLAQNVRDRVMRQFREGTVRCLVATDVVGRGIDVTNISHIINYDIPQFCDDYVHRVGRAGRMGREGVAYTFVTPEEGHELTRIEMRINHLLQRQEITDLLPQRPKPAPQAAASATPPISPSLVEPPLVEPSGVDQPSPRPRKPVFGSRQRRYRRAL